MDALKYIWEGAIPLQIHLHESEVTTVPPPPPAMVSLCFSPSAALPLFDLSDFFNRWTSWVHSVHLSLFLWEIWVWVQGLLVLPASCVFNLVFWTRDAFYVSNVRPSRTLIELNRIELLFIWDFVFWSTLGLSSSDWLPASVGFSD